MNLFDQSKIDANIILTNANEFGQEITLITPDAVTSLNLRGFHTKHHTAFDLDGAMVNSKNATVAISEKTLIEESYPYRDSTQEINLKNHLVNVKDSSDIVKNYIIREQYPDERLGVIVLILGDYETV